MEEGGLLEVTADIENTGDESATQTMVLEIGGEQVDSTSGSLSGGQSTSVTFSYLTADSDAGDRTATVASETPIQRPSPSKQRTVVMAIVGVIPVVVGHRPRCRTIPVIYTMSQSPRLWKNCRSVPRRPGR